MQKGPGFWLGSPRPCRHERIHFGDGGQQTAKVLMVSNSAVQECDSNLWRTDDKGHQVISMHLNWRRNEDLSFRSPASSSLDLQKIEQQAVLHCSIISLMLQCLHVCNNPCSPEDILIV